MQKISQAIFFSMQDIASEHPERFFVAEIVREKIFMQYRNEVPYACQVCFQGSEIIYKLVLLLF